MVEVGVRLPLLFFRLHSVRHVGEDAEVLKAIGQVCKAMPDELEVAMIDTEYRVSLLLLEINQASRGT